MNKSLFTRCLPLLSCTVLAALLSACATSPEVEAEVEAEQARLEAEIGAHKGEAVSRVCPRGNDGWKTLGDDALLIEADDDWYMVELTGMCDPDDASSGIATRTFPDTSCLSRGDAVFTGLPRNGGRCTITAIYAWDDEAVEQPAEASTDEQAGDQ